MKEYKLNITDFLEKSHTMPVIDVRSPAEYDHGHIPGALNLPLFTNEERKIVGTLYVQKGTSDAMMKGLELVGPKMKEFANQAMNLTQGKETLVHCWRGGMRSNSMAWLLNTVGIKASTLEGGYKSYRRHIHEFFPKPFNLIVIGGMTGTGKTDLLEALELQGKQVVNLEQLASHKGSVFGSIGMSSQPTTEQFENDLYTRLSQLNPEEPVFVENESMAIGRIYIPMPFFEQMLSARCLTLVVPIENRVKRLVETYAGGDKNILIEAINRLERRLGPDNAAKAVGCIHNGEMEKAVEIILRYYDKKYSQNTDLRKRKDFLEIQVNNDSSKETARKIINLIQ